MLLILFVLIFGFRSCSGIIHHLNESEYDRMPPIYGLDKYDHCMRDEDGTYCTAKVVLFSETQNDLMTLITDYSAHTYKHYNHSLIERGVCVTKTCRKFINSYFLNNEENIQKLLGSCINETIWNEYGLETKLLEYECTKNNEVQSKDIFDYAVLYLIYGLVLLNVAGTACDFILRRQNFEKNNHHGFKHYLICFSIAQNWNWLVSSEPDDLRLRKLKGLHGVKCIVMYLIIMGHVLFMFHGYTENPHIFEQYYEYTWYKMMFSGWMLVQILFTVSGFLLAYHLLLECEKRDVTWRVVPRIIMLRIWRLTPANALYVFFSATLLRNWGSGPLWKMFVTSRMSGDCRRYWWSHLIFINNYIPDDMYCVVQNWQLATDVQLFIVGLCAFVAVKPHLRTKVFSSLVLLGTILLGLQIWWHDIDPFLTLRPEQFRLFGGPNLYVRKYGHSNMQSFLIGMLTGQFVYNKQKENADFSKYKAILNPVCSLVLPFLAVVLYCGSYFFEDGVKANLAVRIAYGTALSPVLSLVTAYIIFGLIFRLSDFWVNLMEWNGWVVPGRLSYSISLIHTFFVINIFGSRTQLLHVSTLNHNILVLGITSISYFCAIPYCLMVEAPFNRLAKTMMSKNVQQVKKVE